MAPRPLSLSPRPAKTSEGEETRLAAQATSWGWTHGENNGRNYTPLTTFRIFPKALVGGSVECDLALEDRLVWAFFKAVCLCSPLPGRVRWC